MSQPIRLVISDVDGTLVTKQKVLTPQSVAAVQKLKEAGIAFSITSSRPPLGLKSIIDTLELTEPIGAFNGGLFVRPDLGIVEQKFLPPEVAEAVIEAIAGHGLDVWLYTDFDWLVRDAEAPHVARERFTVQFSPRVVAEFSSHLDRVGKIVGVSDDGEAVATCELGVQRMCGRTASATRSQAYYLDVTHPEANKGNVVTTLSNLLGIPPEQIATIGDGPNDVCMFARSGMSIAMGNATPQVQSQAQFVTTSNEEHGFANAIEEIILQQRAVISKKAS